MVKEDTDIEAPEEAWFGNGKPFTSPYAVQNQGAWGER